MNSPQETHRAVALVAVATERAEPEIIVRFKYFVGESDQKFGIWKDGCKNLGEEETTGNEGLAERDVEK